MKTIDKKVSRGRHVPEAVIFSINMDYLIHSFIVLYNALLEKMTYFLIV